MPFQKRRKISWLLSKNISETKYRSIAIHPGRVDTDMNRESAEIAPSECAKDLADILTGKKKLPEKNGF